MTELEVRGETFVVIPKREYLRLKAASGEDIGDEGDAFAFMNLAIGENIRKARVAAGITQAELAKRLNRSQALVSSAENGTKEVGARYVKAVLKACGLPEDWTPGE